MSEDQRLREELRQDQGMVGARGEGPQLEQVPDEDLAHGQVSSEIDGTSRVGFKARLRSLLKGRAIGHAAALFTVMVWGTTFISTKVLLADFGPVEILLIRFVLGYLALAVVTRRPLRGTTPRQELTLALAGLTGVCLYYLLENVALQYSFASNVGVLVSIAPLFTAIAAWLKGIVAERRAHMGGGDMGANGTAGSGANHRHHSLNAWFMLGSVPALVGVGMISFNGSQFQLNPLGDVLAILAALAWTFYSLNTERASGFGFNMILVTRRIFAYGIAFMIPAALLMGADLFGNPERYADPLNIGNLLFLGLGASAMCFVTWNFGVKTLGAVESGVYIYLTPAVTVVFAAIVLGEPVTLLMAIGTALVLGGVVLSERR